MGPIISSSKVFLTFIPVKQCSQQNFCQNYLLSITSFSVVDRKRLDRFMCVVTRIDFPFHTNSFAHRFTLANLTRLVIGYRLVLSACSGERLCLSASRTERRYPVPVIEDYI